MIFGPVILRAATLALLSVAAVAFDAAAAEQRRMTSPAEQAVWSAVGRLNVTGQGYCTGTLVAPDIVLTAAHCLMNKRTGQPVRPGDIHFLPGFRIGRYLGHGRGRRIAMLPGYDRARKTVHLDLALVQLDAPMPASVIPASLDAGVHPAQDVILLSYGLDRSQLLSAERDCRVEKRQGPLIFTTCEGLPGVSGGPLFQVVDGRPLLVAVASSIMARTKAPIPRGQVLAVEVSTAQVDRLRGQIRLRPKGVPSP